jgi:hypothetical protein
MAPKYDARVMDYAHRSLRTQEYVGTEKEGLGSEAGRYSTDHAGFPLRTITLTNANNSGPNLRPVNLRIS